ncbi:MAG TPA: hypothetical protein VFV92_07535 [Candidatus Bathyarchaeia archaeon]|nr:hypothetical protein [Candidatus Bathyarchaeia archaeon]
MRVTSCQDIAPEVVEMKYVDRVRGLRITKAETISRVPGLPVLQAAPRVLKPLGMCGQQDIVTLKVQAPLT